jgi:ech hydrogenase subunit E
MQPQKTEQFTVPIGPQHPALKEPSSFLITVDGEVVTNAVVRLGYAHRGIEKAAESRTYTQDLYLLERICGICSHIHGTAFAMGVERLAGAEVPPRAQAIRLVIAELERIHSHMLWLGVAAHQGGFDALFMFSWRDRETVMDLLESISGNRVNYSANILGGVKFDLTDAHVGNILKALDYLEERTTHYLDVVSTDTSFLQRTRGIGTMTRHQAEVLGAIGPTARASGVVRDVRIEAPYGAYVDHPVTAIIDDRGDLEARFAVRIKELFESYRLIREVLDGLPPGEIKTRVKRRVPEGEVAFRVEAPRGELFYFIKSDGTDIPSRVKVRTPTICNMTSVVKLAVGHQLADVPMILAGIDPCFSCNDRMVRINRSSGSDGWTWEQLRQHGIEYYKQRSQGYDPLVVG